MEHIKFYILTLLALSACSLFQPKEEVKFKNPIFYQRMESASTSRPYDIIITPTTKQIFYNEKADLVYTDPCELLENSETRVLMKCCDNNNCTYLRYTSAGETHWGNCNVIEEESFQNPDFEFCNAQGFFIDKKLLPNHECGPAKTWNYRACKWQD